MGAKPGLMNAEKAGKKREWFGERKRASDRWGKKRDEMQKSCIEKGEEWWKWMRKGEKTVKKWF